MSEIKTENLAKNCAGMHFIKFCPLWIRFKSQERHNPCYRGRITMQKYSSSKYDQRSEPKAVKHLKGNSGMEATLVQNKVYLPLIIVLLFVFTKLALSVSNRGKGLNFLYVLDDAIFFNHRRLKLDTRFQNEAS